MPDAQAIKDEAANFLAGLYKREHEIRFLLRDAGLDLDDFPPLGGMPLRDWWASSCGELDNKMQGGLASVLGAVRIRFPGRRADAERLVAKLASSGRRTIKVLFLAANPVDREVVRVGAEMERIAEALRSRDFPVSLEFKSRLAVEPTDFLEAILTEQPDVVHFSGHGEPEGLVMEGRDGEAVVLSGRTLGDLFERVNGLQNRRRVCCVLLNACHSQAVAAAISRGVDVVVATKHAIADDAAPPFSRVFYLALAQGQPVGDAVRLGQGQVGVVGDALGYSGPALGWNGNRGEGQGAFDPDNVIVVERIPGISGRLLPGAP